MEEEEEEEEDSLAVWTCFSLEGEIDRFRFEEVAIVISEIEEEVDEYLCVQAPASIITYMGDSSRQKQVQASCESSSSSASC